MTFVIVSLLVMLMAGAAHAKPDGSFGTDCGGCHANGIGGDTSNTPPADRPAIPPTDPPPTEPPSTPPTDPPPTAPPSYLASDHIGSLELGTVWHYGSLDTADEPKYVFYAAVETDASVNLVDVITPKGNRLQITDEPSTEADNVKTWFDEVDDVRVWQYEATFSDAGELKGYGKGDYTVEVHHDGGTAEAKVKYGGAKPIWGAGASVGGVKKEDQPLKGADKNFGGQKPDKNKPDKNVTADERENDGHDKKNKGKSKKKSHKPKKPKHDDDDDDEEEE